MSQAAGVGLYAYGPMHDNFLSTRHAPPHAHALRGPALAGACTLALLCGGCFEPSDPIGDTDAMQTGTADDGSGGPDDGGSGISSGMSSGGSGESGGPSMTTMTPGTTLGDDSSGTGDTADGTTGDGSTGEPADTTAPEIVSISPDDGAAGVLADASITITFSEAMDTAATEAAFQSADLGGVSMAWSEGDTVLTIDPDADLDYASGDDPATVVALEYELSVGVGAADVAGNPLENEVQSSFTTAREITTELASDPALTGAVVGDGTLNTGAGGQAVAGDHADNLQRKGFFSFALADLPAGIVAVQQATLSASQVLTLGTPFSAPLAGLGSLGIDHVEFDTLDIDAFNANPLDDLGVFSNTPTDGARTMDVAANLADDIDSGRSHSQYRLEFTTATNNNGVTDRTRFSTQSIDVVILIE